MGTRSASWRNATGIITPPSNPEKADKRCRWQVRFWLDLEKDDERQLAENVFDLKEKRSFAGAIRDGLRLIVDLRRGKTDVLRELFPWVLEHQVVQVSASTPPATTRQPSAAPAEDFELEIKRTGNTEDNNSSWNFMIASSMQVYGNCNALPPHIVDYAVRTGRIPADMAPNRAVTEGNPGKSGVVGAADLQRSPDADRGPKSMDVPQFEAPEFDDMDEIEW